MTKDDYEGYLRALLDKFPDSPLLPDLRTGYSRVNVIYMRHAIKNLVVQEEEVPGPAEEKETDPTDPVLRELWAEKGRLFRQRGKLSNKFHDCKTDAERKRNSDNILAVWEQIQVVKAKIAHYEEYGSLPKEEERFPLPDDPAELLKKLMSIRSLISQEQQKIRKIGELPDEHPEKAERLEASEKRLAELKLYRGYAEQKAKANSATIHS